MYADERRSAFISEDLRLLYVLFFSLYLSSILNLQSAAMGSNEYQFITEWDLDAPIEEVFDVIENGSEFPRWWPEVYLDARAEKKGRPDRKGDKLHLHTKGWLPYTLRWTAEVIESSPPIRLEFAATGDFVGRGIWTLTNSGPKTHARFDWSILAEKPLLRRLSFIFKPIFSWNHQWAMARGRERITEELARRLKEKKISA